MEKGAQLRLVLRQKLTITGAHKIDHARNCVLLQDFKATDNENKLRKVVTEGTIKIETKAEIGSKDRVLFVRVNPELYLKGTVECTPLVSPRDETQPISFYYTPKERTDLTKLDHIIELYVGE